MRWGFLVLVALLAGCTILQVPMYGLSFTILETGKSVDGNVYLNGKFLGRTHDGQLSVPKDNVTEGSIQFTGYYQGRAFNYTYSLSTDNLRGDKLSFTLEQAALERFTMRFFINETGEPVDGTVINNDHKIGQTVNGELSIPAVDVQEGKIIIQGDLRGKPFEFRFTLTADNIDSYKMEFIITQQDLQMAVFNAADLNRLELEQEVVRLVNVQRAKFNTTHLKWNAKAASVAYLHSKDMADRDYFAHQNPEGLNVGERLKEANVFYTVAAEDLSLFENIRPDTNLSDKAVEGWMNSPGHRAPIIDPDHLFSDAGAGVACVIKTCYITLVLIGNEREVEPDLPPQYLSFYYLYDPSYGFEQPVPVGLRVDSDSPITMYIVKNRQSYDELLKGQNTDYIEKYPDTQLLETQLTVEPNMGIVLENKGDKEAKIKLRIDYYP